jgi:hypothetical protein
MPTMNRNHGNQGNFKFALAQLARETLPRYEADNGSLTSDQLALIDKLVSQGEFVVRKSLF